MARGFDALTVPDLGAYATLRAIGFELACGYTRALTPLAVRTSLGLGYSLLPITEAGTPTDLSYFTPQQGHDDGARFVAWADAVGMPSGVPFVGVPLDFDCPVSAMEPTILPYVNEQFNAVGMRNPLWIYGPRLCIEYALSRWAGIAGAMQAFAPAWNGGANATPSALADVIQVGGATVAGIVLDVQVVRTAARLWRLA